LTDSQDSEKKTKLTFAGLSLALRELVWPRRGLLSAGLVLILINRLAGLVLPGVSKYVIDDVVQKRNLALLKTIVLVAGAAVAVQAVTSTCVLSSSSTSGVCRCAITMPTRPEPSFRAS